MNQGAQFITDAVTAMRADLLEHATTAATRVRTTYGSDGAGGRTAQTTSTLALDVHVQPRAAIEPEIAGRLTERADFVMFYTPSADVLASDVVTVGSNTYEVTDVLQPSTVEPLRVAGLMRLS